MQHSLANLPPVLAYWVPSIITHVAYAHCALSLRLHWRIQWHHDVDGELRILEAMDKDQGLVEGGCNATCQVGPRTCRERHPSVPCTKNGHAPFSQD